ncbi:MAG TPA: cysteine hydrolase [Lichenihabitans sp.]|jgi:nicotinamidase-related amidase|nr:cysteine hydrolase [Lichenihabitans sp.]
MTRDDVDRLRFGPLASTTLHLCVDMQALFAGDTAWHTPWMRRILPNVERIARAHPAQTIFTRFVPAANAEAAPGRWRAYYERWADMTRDRLAPGMIDLMDPLGGLVPPAEVFDKTAYGPWLDGTLDRRLKARSVDTLVVTGGETDVCVLATVFGAVDLGYRTIVVSDALCSASDATHDDAKELLGRRFDVQVEMVSTDTLLDAWKPA